MNPGPRSRSGGTRTGIPRVGSEAPAGVPDRHPSEQRLTETGPGVESPSGEGRPVGISVMVARLILIQLVQVQILDPQFKKRETRRFVESPAFHLGSCRLIADHVGTSQITPTRRQVVQKSRNGTRCTEEITGSLPSLGRKRTTRSALSTASSLRPMALRSREI